tara:strand:+ start:21 stop:869 length:849 start_codon:yes stop_codon:yes gene_type:complete
MDPQLIDYYNEMPSGINVIDKMNEELDDLQKKYDALEKKHTDYITFNGKPLMPKIRVNTIDELKKYAEKIYNSVPIFKEIIYDFLNHEGWILDYDRPDGVGKGMMSYKGCGFWDTMETDYLQWGNTTAQAFYYNDNCGITRYNLYLKCKLLDEVYRLFPEYTERKRGWFHQQIDECFGNVDLTITTIIENDLFQTKEQLHDIIYKIIMEQLFGWGCDYGDGGIGIFPFEYENEDYIQNIIYYQCKNCKKILNGEDFMKNSSNSKEYWYSENGDWLSDEPCRC